MRASSYFWLRKFYASSLFRFPLLIFFCLVSASPAPYLLLKLDLAYSFTKLVDPKTLSTISQLMTHLLFILVAGVEHGLSSF